MQDLIMVFTFVQTIVMGFFGMISRNWLMQIPIYLFALYMTLRLIKLLIPRGGQEE